MRDICFGIGLQRFELFYNQKNEGRQSEVVLSIKFV